MSALAVLPRTVAQIVAELAASSLSDEQLALVIELAAVAMPTRSKHAQAQARYRARRKEVAAIPPSHVITGDHSDHAGSSVTSVGPLPSPSSSPPSMVSPITPSLTTPSPPSTPLSPATVEFPSFFTEFKQAEEEIVEGRKRPVKGTRLPDDWCLSPALVEMAVAHGLRPAEFEAEFRDYWVAIPGHRGVKLDWEATARNRIRAIGAQRKGKSNGHRSSIADACAELKFELGGQGHGGQGGAYMRDVTPPGR